MNAPRGSWAACLLRACSPAAAIAVATSLGGAWLAVRHGDVVAEAQALGLRAEAARLVLAAQTIASGPWAAAAGQRRVEVAGRSYLVTADGARLEVEGRDGAKVGVDVLPGAPPLALSSPRSATADDVLAGVKHGWLRGGWQHAELWHPDARPADVLRRRIRAPEHETALAAPREGRQRRRSY